MGTDGQNRIIEGGGETGLGESIWSGRFAWYTCDPTEFAGSRRGSFSPADCFGKSPDYERSGRCQIQPLATQLRHRVYPGGKRLLHYWRSRSDAKWVVQRPVNHRGKPGGEGRFGWLKRVCCV